MRPFPRLSNGGAEGGRCSQSKEGNPESLSQSNREYQSYRAVGILLVVAIFTHFLGNSILLCCSIDLLPHILVPPTMASRRAIARIPTLAARASLPRAAPLCTRMSSPVNSSKVAVRRLHATAQHLKPASAAAVESYPMSHEQIQSPKDTQNFLDNKFVSSQTSQWIELHDPATNNLVTRVPQSTDAELRAAVDSAEKAFKPWKETSLLHRQQIMFKYTHLIRENWDRLAASITLEQGKTFADARGDVLRGLQVAETSCGITTQMTGEVLEVAKDMETRSYREPLGVVAAICPFSQYTAMKLWPNTNPSTQTFQL